MDGVQAETNEASVDSQDLILLNDYIDLLLDPTLPIEQFYINSCIPVSPKKDHSIKNYRISLNNVRGH